MLQTIILFSFHVYMYIMQYSTEYNHHLYKHIYILLSKEYKCIYLQDCESVFHMRKNSPINCQNWWLDIKQEVFVKACFDGGLYSSNIMMSYSKQKQNEEYENMLFQRLSCILKCQAYWQSNVATGKGYVGVRWSCISSAYVMEVEIYNSWHIF